MIGRWLVGEMDPDIWNFQREKEVPTLYESALNSVAANYHLAARNLLTLPPHMLLDIFGKLRSFEKSKELLTDLSFPQVFFRILEVKRNKHLAEVFAYACKHSPTFLKNIIFHYTRQTCNLLTPWSTIQSIFLSPPLHNVLPSSKQTVTFLPLSLPSEVSSDFQLQEPMSSSSLPPPSSTSSSFLPLHSSSSPPLSQLPPSLPIFSVQVLNEPQMPPPLLEFCHRKNLTRSHLRMLRHSAMVAVKFLMSTVDSASKGMPRSMPKCPGAVLTEKVSEALKKHAHLGLTLGRFLLTNGQLNASEKVLTSCMKICQSRDDSTYWWSLSFNCSLYLLRSRNANFDLDGATSAQSQVERYLNLLEGAGLKVRGKPAALSEFSILCYLKSQFSDAYEYSCKALMELSSEDSYKAVADVFRQAAKVCIIRSEIQRADFLLQSAIQVVDPHLPHDYSAAFKNVEILIDYASCLLQSNHLMPANILLRVANIFRLYFMETDDLLLGMVNENLAYCQYVINYSTGDFGQARDYIDKALEIYTRVLPDDHVTIAIAKKVKAQILEELSMIGQEEEQRRQFATKSEELHLTSLETIKKKFGEASLYTAKSLSSLGRFYQTRKDFEKARLMHCQSLGILVKVMGASGPEVVMSLGQLASVLNYDLAMYDEAEQLYLEAIFLAKSSLGEDAPTLEFDYRGLINIYLARGNQTGMTTYQDALDLYLEEKRRRTENIYTRGRLAELIQKWRVRGGTLTNEGANEPVLDVRAVVNSFFSDSATTTT